MAEEFASDFVLDPNRNDGYPAVDSIPDSDFGSYYIPDQLEYYFLSDLDIYNGVLEGYPSFGEDIAWTNYYIPDQDSIKLYMEARFTDIGYGNILEGYPSFGEDIAWLPVSLTGFSNVDMYVICDLDTHEGIMDNYFTFDNTENWKMFGAFSNTNITRVNIPASVKNIDNWAFYNCPNLERVKIARDCLYYENSFPPDCIIEYHNE